MEIGPVPGIRAFAAAKTLPEDFQLSAAADVEAAARPGDSLRPGERKKRAIAEGMDADGVAFSGEVEPREDLAEEPADDEAAGHVSFFA